MTTTAYRRPGHWSARLLIALVLVIAGAAAATWALARYEPAARFLGVLDEPATPAPPQRAVPSQAQPTPLTQPGPALPGGEPADLQLAALESRLARVESATQRAEGFAGRADALVVAFAARRAIDRGVALGYLENLLVQRFGAQHRQAIATIITASHQPVRLNALIADYEQLGPQLRRGGPQDSWWTGFRRELGSLVQVHRADQPSRSSQARYQRALQRLYAGEVDQALAETMRMPGASHAEAWVASARRYVAAHRALDEIESAALMGAAAQR